MVKTKRRNYQKRKTYFLDFFIDFGTYCLFITLFGIILQLWMTIYEKQPKTINGYFNTLLFLIINAWTSLIITIIIYKEHLEKLKRGEEYEKANKTKH